MQIPFYEIAMYEMPDETCPNVAWDGKKDDEILEKLTQDVLD